MAEQFSSKFFTGNLQGMPFKVTYTNLAETVVKWILFVKEQFLDGAAVKCVGLDCEFTDKPNNCGKHWERKVHPSQQQRAAVLQLSVASHCLVFHIICADAVPPLLVEFLADAGIRFCGAAIIQHDVQKLQPYGVTIPGAVNVQQLLPNPTPYTTPGLVALANAHLGTNLDKDDSRTAKIRQGGWAAYPLSLERISYAALDARLGFELAKLHWGLVGYDA